MNGSQRYPAECCSCVPLVVGSGASVDQPGSNIVKVDEARVRVRSAMPRMGRHPSGVPSSPIQALQALETSTRTPDPLHAIE